MEPIIGRCKSKDAQTVFPNFRTVGAICSMANPAYYKDEDNDDAMKTQLIDTDEYISDGFNNSNFNVQDGSI